MKANIKRKLKDSVKGVISFNKNLRECTTFKIGGVPKVWAEPQSLGDLVSLLTIFFKAGLDVILIGMGSNMLLYDGKIAKAVVRLSAPCFRKARFDGARVSCGSGLSLTGLVKRCIERGLSGLECLAGIPGTVGGAIMMNAGTQTGSMGDVIEWVKVVDYKGNHPQIIHRDKVKFNYRENNLRRHIILEVGLKLRRRRPEVLKERFRRLLRDKLVSQEYKWPSAGCVFKNPSNSSLKCGQLLERCGLKGMRIGDAQVSTKHANFIINRGNAGFDDVMSLIRLERRIVKKRCGIWLEPEIKIIR